MSSSSTAAAASPRQLNPSHNSPRTGGTRRLGMQTASPARRAATGSATQTITPLESASSRSVSPDPLVLRLRGAHDASGSSTTRAHRRRIAWAEDVVDNEGMGRKSSKVCCIYHKAREFGESSSEDDSSSDSDSGDSDAGGSDGPEDGRARLSGNRRGRKHDHGHQHGDDCDHGKDKAARKPSPNAYERMPKYNTKREDTTKR
ncbi:hypothetical protein A1O3_10151 [Capronia epimyces CBS 606.96]|uniref:Type 1 phosphatases regulator n=1 Tax=Capronia epimyces CBS 606.96 TaxID=1182542 RepID=W9Y3G3_9EURO|nr:uncharacterized protein A1O3_10151 [Capronia epimyces CBS 606.96]EXJ76994.1 hypothetical protein A1O3_10151 [Capronia epimyces CBS 606.96]